MYGGIFGLRPNQKQYLYLNMTVPSIIVIWGLKTRLDGVYMVILYQLICCIILPNIYIKMLSKEKEIKAYFINELNNRNQQLKEGLSYFMGGFSVVFLIYLFNYEFRMNILQHLNLPITHQPSHMIGLFITIGLIAPITEEWLWRVFFIKTFENTYCNKLMINSFYALYHMIVVWHCAGWLSGLVAFSNYLSLAVSLHYIQENHGFISSTLCHYGINLALILCLLDVSLEIQSNPKPIN